MRSKLWTVMGVALAFGMLSGCGKSPKVPSVEESNPEGSGPSNESGATEKKKEVKEEEPKKKSLDPKNDVHTEFRLLAQSIFTDLLKDASEDEKKKLAEALKVKPDKITEASARKLLEAYKDQFTLTEEEAQKILSGKTDDYKNLKESRRIIKLLESVKVPLPGPTRIIIERIQKFEIKKGLKLEFATRYLKGQYTQIRNAMKRQR